MSFSIDTGITDFFIRRRDFFEDINLYGSFQERMKELRDRMNSASNHKPSVVISGAGPAGLIRAIQSISNGNPTVLIEKRGDDIQGRINTVHLRPVTVAMLRYCGIYQYLMENKLIFPPKADGSIMVRLTDLEKAMKAVLKEISPSFAIQYHTKIEDIDAQTEKINLTLENSETKEKRAIKKVDILVNAEGKGSSTNPLLGIERTEVLPSIPVIAAVYKDKRPKIQGIGSFFKFVGKSIAYLAITIHYHVQFFFKFLFSKKFRNCFTGSLILKTPKQNYVGAGLSDKINGRLQLLKAAAASKGAGSKEEKEYKNFAKKWIGYSICLANLIANKVPHFCKGTHRSLAKFEIIKIGADHANQFCKSIHQTSVLLGGDAGATVDPTTGLGCNTAIQSSVDFLDFIWDSDKEISPNTLLKEYSERATKRIKDIHIASIQARALYRPDALIPMMM